ncbi:MAG TPA: type II secretion system F family protein [Phycisphaerae bacterium]|nr:type II secretion system F family protein [Phycisphaerae bacterium]HOI55335.1 type II secretion system F family protein [Phycisphaerae bacterium]
MTTTPTYSAQPIVGSTRAPAAAPVQAAEPAAPRASIMTVQLGARITQRDILTVTRQLSVMVKAGISITQALENMAQQTTNPKLAKLLFQLYDDVEAGKPFSEAVAAHPKVFSPLYIHMIQASELSGSFSHILSRIADYLSQQLETRSQVIAAMLYPMIIGVMAVLVTIFMLTFILPQFLVFFEGKEDLLPLPTTLLLGLSWSMTTFWYFYIAGAIALAIGLVVFSRTDAGHYFFDTLKLNVPVFKKLFHCLYLSRGLKTMGELVNAGVPMLETLNVTAKVTGNLHYRDLWLQVRDTVQQGQTISQTLLRSTLMPRGVTQMISAGEESGSLANVLADVSEFYDRELKAVIKASTAVIEPLMIIVMGGVVGFVASSIMLPIFQLSRLVK